MIQRLADMSGDLSDASKLMPSHHSPLYEPPEDASIESNAKELRQGAVPDRMHGAIVVARES